MEMKLMLMLFAAVICAGILFIILSRSKSNQSRAVWIRSIIFFGIIAYLAYDFCMKEKYSILIVLALGSIAFIVITRDMVKKDKT
jgi:hypothetical protein